MQLELALNAVQLINDDELAGSSVRTLLEMLRESSEFSVKIFLI